jgi:hypothetical protein
LRDISESDRWQGLQESVHQRCHFRICDLWLGVPTPQAESVRIFVLANPRRAQVFGLQSRACVGSPFSAWLFLQPRDPASQLPQSQPSGQKVRMQTVSAAQLPAQLKQQFLQTVRC